MVKYDMPVEIIPNIYWIGNYSSDPFLHPNPFILNLEGESIVFDPGGVNDFSVVTQKILNLTELENIKYILLSHQDPDICGMTHFLEEMLPGPVSILTHSNNEHFIRHYGITSPVTYIRDNNYQLKLPKSGLEIEFIHTPFLHSPGSFMTYIRDYKILFSSDLFGWIGNEKWELFDNDIDKQGYIDWHMNIVPHKRILKPVLEKLRTLDIEILAPQHGSILRGKDIIAALFTKLEKINYALKDFLGD